MAVTIKDKKQDIFDEYEKVVAESEALKEASESETVEGVPEDLSAAEYIEHLQGQITKLADFLLEDGRVDGIGAEGGAVDHAIVLIQSLEEEAEQVEESTQRSERYEAIGRKAEAYLKREQSATLAWQSDEARALKRELTALIEG